MEYFYKQNPIGIYDCHQWTRNNPNNKESEFSEAYQKMRERIGMRPNDFADMLIKNIMWLYPHKYTCVRFDPWSDVPSMMFCNIEDGVIDDVQSPKFNIVVEDGKIKSIYQTGTKYNLQCAVDRFNYNLDIEAIKVDTEGAEKIAKEKERTDKRKKLVNICRELGITDLKAPTTCTMLYTEDYGKTSKEVVWQCNSVYELWENYLGVNTEERCNNGIYYFFKNGKVADAMSLYIEVFDSEFVSKAREQYAKRMQEIKDENDNINTNIDNAA